MARFIHHFTRFQVNNLETIPILTPLSPPSLIFVVIHAFPLLTNIVIPSLLSLSSLDCYIRHR